MESQWTVERTARALGICCLLSLGFLLVWFFGFLVAGGLAFDIHSSLIDIDRHEFDLIIYGCMAFFKLIVFVCFLMPYIALKLMLRGERTA